MEVVTKENYFTLVTYNEFIKMFLPLRLFD